MIPGPAFRILVIDDNPVIAQDFIKILTPSHFHSHQLDALDQELFGSHQTFKEQPLPTFQINTASQGLEGIRCIEKALKEGKPYAVAFVDVRMPPGIDGIKTIKRF